LLFLLLEVEVVDHLVIKEETLQMVLAVQAHRLNKN
jgi:hypothetical protein